MTYIIKLDYHMDICPKAWQNFMAPIIQLMEANGIENEEKPEPIPFTDSWNPINEHLINKNLVAFNGCFHPPLVIFDSEEDAIYFKLRWG